MITDINIFKSSNKVYVTININSRLCTLLIESIKFMPMSARNIIEFHETVVNNY